ncbi:superoxide dismutase family protein [Noviherbaspirillum aerium]|uniref:superoxide dismutase family protein n=1 Tax=Noviherbaspirillum aerium TaxID=2588497 RepID=UPI00124DF155|nr:superoxide dismutase family protein [Noviherbaspirillum aerium]
MDTTVAKDLAAAGKLNAGSDAEDRHARTGRQWMPALVTLVALAVICTPAGASDTGAEARIFDRSGNQVGKLTLSQQENGGVSVQVRVNDLPPGFHGFHVHAVGECTPPFTSAGGHFDKDKHAHGNHSGDLPVLQVKADGSAKATVNTDRFSVADLFDGDGSAIIIHANPDNYANIPTRYAAAPDAATLATGDAGDRIACGVLEKAAKK